MLTFKLDMRNLDKFKARVKKQSNDGLKSGLHRMAGFIKTVAKNSMRTTARGGKDEVHSRPGEPPRSKLGLIKHNIRFQWNEAQRSMTIGPRPLAGRITGALEHGGAATVMSGKGPKRAPKTVYIRARPFLRPALKKAMEPARIKKFFSRVFRPHSISVSIGGGE